MTLALPWVTMPPHPPSLSMPVVTCRWLSGNTGCAWCLVLVICWVVSGCGTRRESPFAEDPPPDLAVTTLARPDIDAVASVVQIQGAILMGCGLAVQKQLSTPMITMVDAVHEQCLSRARDLDALVRVKNAPRPDGLGMRYSTLIDTLAEADPMAWDPALITFFRALHTDAMRILRDAADRSGDPDVQALATRQLPGMVSLLDRLERLSEQTP